MSNLTSYGKFDWLRTQVALPLSHIIIMVYSFVAFSNQHKFDPRRAKKASSIQYDNRKWGTHARVFSQTLEDGNSKNEKRRAEKRKILRSKVARNKRVPRPSCNSDLPTPWGCYSPKHRMNCRSNLTLHL